MAGGMDLKAFLMRNQVLSLYRDAMRTCARAPPHARGELQATMREEWEKQREVTDLSQVKFFISEGRQRLKELQDMLGMK